jgi:uncharacterized membrane protein YhhN
MTDYKMVSKPLIMGSLIGFYIGTAHKQSPVFILAMIFALFGDIFLMFKSEDFFLIGLISFFFMQILYAITFLRDRSVNVSSNIIAVVSVLALAVLILWSIWNGLGAMKIPVTVYSMAISLMVITAIIRDKNVRWYVPVLVGVLLFMVSDGGIAFNKFGNPFRGANYFIIFTYMIAQYLIVRGVVERDQK